MLRCLFMVGDMKICFKCGNRNYYKPGEEIKCKGCGQLLEKKKPKYHAITSGNSMTDPKPFLGQYDDFIEMY